MNYVYVYIHPEYGHVYVGKAANLCQRLRNHKYSESDNIHADGKKILETCSIYYLELANAAQAVCVEAYLIDKWKPMLNGTLKEESGGFGIEMQLPEWKKFDEARLLNYIQRVEHERHIQMMNDRAEELSREKKRVEEAIEDLRKKEVASARVSGALEDDGFVSKNGEVFLFGWESVQLIMKYCPLYVTFDGITFDKNGNVYSRCVATKIEGNVLYSVYDRKYGVECYKQSDPIVNVMLSRVNFSTSKKTFCELMEWLPKCTDGKDKMVEIYKSMQEWVSDNEIIKEAAQ